MRYAAGLLSGIIWLAGCVAAPSEGAAPLAEDGTPCIADRDALMAMDYWTFDQGPEGSQAIYSKPGCELAAADLIRDYHAVLRTKGEPVTHTFPQGTVTFSETGEIMLLYWHEGQIRAMNGQTEAGAELFRKSIKPEDRNVMGWNEYVRALLAFLAGDRAALEAERASLAAKVPPDNVNLGVLDGLIACFDRSYKDAYGAPECNRRPGRQPAVPQARIRRSSISVGMLSTCPITVMRERSSIGLAT